jgi:acyl carrier protein
MTDQSTQDRSRAPLPTAEAIADWVIGELSERLGVDPEEIDPRRPFAFYGLDSAEAVILAGELEEWLGCTLSATLLWEYPTIEALAGYLAQEIAASRSVAGHDAEEQ